MRFEGVAGRANRPDHVVLALAVPAILIRSHLSCHRRIPRHRGITVLPVEVELDGGGEVATGRREQYLRLLVRQAACFLHGCGPTRGANTTPGGSTTGPQPTPTGRHCGMGLEHGWRTVATRRCGQRPPQHGYARGTHSHHGWGTGATRASDETASGCPECCPGCPGCPELSRLSRLLPCG